MSEIDALSLSITASTKQAEDKINSLIRTLKGLDSAFRSLTGSTTYANNLETAVHAITRVNNAIANINSDKMASVAKSMRELGRAGSILSNFGNIDKTGQAMDNVSSKATNLASNLSKMFNIKDKNAISELTESIQKMIDTMGRGDAYYQAESNVQRIIEEFSRFDNQLGDTLNTYNKVREKLRQNPLYIPENFSSEADWLKNKATIGITNTTSDITKGVSAGQLKAELEGLIPALQGLSNESDIINTIADWLRNNATPAMVDFNTAVEQGSVPVNAASDAVKELAQSLGVIMPTAQQTADALNSIDWSKFADADDMWIAETEAIQQLRDQLQPAITDIDRLAESNQKISNTQPFETIVSGLESLQGVTIGDFSNITTLAEGVNKLGYQSAVTAAQILPQIADGLRGFNFNLPEMTGMEEFAKGLRSLGSKAVQNAASSLPFVADGLRQLGSITLPDMTNLTEFAKALSIFGRKTSTIAVQNIPQLAKAFQQLFTVMSKAPKISQNTIDAANAMANLASKTGGVTRALTSATPKLNLWSGAAKNASKSTFSLAAAIGKVYASYWMLFRVFGIFKQSIEWASNLEEVRNYVVQAFGDMAYKAYEFADIAGDSFGIFSVDALKTVARYQSMGRTMEITDKKVSDAHKYLRKELSETLEINEVKQAYGDLGDTAADMAINIAKLAGDFASLRDDLTFDEVSEKFDSIYTGTTKPLRELGFTIKQTTLAEWAMRNGLDADIKSMSEAERAILRYKYVMANADYVMGDFIRTSESWHNSITRLKLAFKNLGTVIGSGLINILKPVIQKITAFVNTLTGLIQKAINAIGKLLGWQMEIDPVAPSSGSGYDDMADAMEDAEDASGGTADNLEDGAKAAKKMKDYLLGIDELNVFRPDEDTSSSKGKSGSGSGSGAGGGSKGGATGGGVNFVPYESDINSWYNLGRTMADKIGEALWNVDWDKIKAKAQTFATNLASLLNGVIDSDIFWTGIGHTIAEGINTALVFAETFLDNLRWGKLGKQVGNLINQAVADFEWDRLGRTIAKGINAAATYMRNLGETIDFKAIGEGIATSINNFFETWDSAELAAALNVWVNNLWTLISSTISNIKWGKIWDKVKRFFNTLELDTLAVIIGGITWKIAGRAILEQAKKALLAKLGSLFLKLTLKDVVFTITSFSLQWAGTPTFDAIIAPLVEKFDEEFSKAFPNLSDLIGHALAGTAVGGVAGAWIGMLGGPIGALAGAIIGALAGAFTSDVFEPVRKAIVENVFNFDTALDLGNQMITHFKNAFSGDLNFGEIGIEIVKGIGKGILGALAFLAEPIADLFAWIWKGICKIFKISSPAKAMNPIGQNILLGIIEGFRGKFQEFTKAISDWFDKSVKPWFTLEKWKEVSDGVKTGILAKWTEFTTEWIPKITNWWNTNVTPWFTFEKWAEEAQHIKEAIKKKWDETVGQWIIDIADWWNTHVVPWFSLQTWKTEADHIRDAVITKLGEMVGEWKTKIEAWWKEHVQKYFKADTWIQIGKDIKEGILSGIDIVKEWKEKIEQLMKDFKDVFKESEFAKIGKAAIDSVLSGFKTAWSDVISWVNEKVEWLKDKFTIKAKVESDDSSQQSTTPTTNNKTKKKVKTTTKATGGVFDDGRWRNIHAYGMGGMPDEGQLFWARERGAELVGQINGNTAVMNNDQIVASVASGVQQAVTEALSPYLSDISTNTRITASKDFTVQIGDRQIAEASNRGQRQLGAVLFT